MLVSKIFWIPCWGSQISLPTDLPFLHKVTPSTVARENDFITATIDAFENRDVAAVELPGAFPHTDIDTNNVTIDMVLQGEFIKLMVKVNPSMYEKYAISEKKCH